MKWHHCLQPGCTLKAKAKGHLKTHQESHVRYQAAADDLQHTSESIVDYYAMQCLAAFNLAKDEMNKGKVVIICCSSQNPINQANEKSNNVKKLEKAGGVKGSVGT